MDTRLSADRISEERAFIQRYTDTLASRPVNYSASYVPPLDQRPRKVGVISVSTAIQLVKCIPAACYRYGV